MHCISIKIQRFHSSLLVATFDKPFSFQCNTKMNYEDKTCNVRYNNIMNLLKSVYDIMSNYKKIKKNENEHKSVL